MGVSPEYTQLYVIGEGRRCPIGNGSYEENSDNRCLIYRMGGGVQGVVFEWNLIMNPHKLPGAVGSFPCSQTFLPHIRGCHVLVRTDNATVVAYVNRQGGAHDL